MPGKRWKRLSPFRKKAFAVALTAAVVSNTLNIGSFIVNADTSERGRIITAFEELPDNIAYQYLPVGSEESDIVFPDTLNVTLYSEEKEEKETPSTEEATEEAPSEESSTEEPSEEAPAEEPEEEVPAEEAPTEEAPSEESSTEEATEAAPGDEGSKDVPADGKGTEEAPAEEATAEDSVREASGEENKAEEAPAEEKPAEEAPQEASGEENKTEEAPAEEKPTEEAPAEETPAEEAPAEEKPAEEAPAEEAPKEEAPAEGDSVAFLEEALRSLAPVTAYAAEYEDGGERVEELPDGERRTLTDVKWNLNREKSAYGSYFQAEIAGDVFIYEPDIRAYGLKSDAPLPEIRVTITGDKEEAGEEKEEGKSEEITLSPAFSQFVIAGRNQIRVDAESGVLPEGALIRVRKVDSDTDRLNIEKAVISAEGEESAEGRSFSSYDITILDADGNEIQPDRSKGAVTVTFSGFEGEELSVYHMDNDLSCAEKLSARADSAQGSVTVDAEHFSVFTVVTGQEKAEEVTVEREEDSLILQASAADFLKPYRGVYDGEAHPAVTISGNIPEKLEQSLRFTMAATGVSSDKIPEIKDAGTYSVVVTYPDYMSGSYVVKSEISRKSIDPSMIKVSDSYYIGSAVENAIVMDDDLGIQLTKDVDYKISYANNVNPGTASVTVEGMNNYTGKAVKTFSIIKYSGTYAFRYNGAAAPAEWYKESVDVTADGYFISENPSGPFDTKYTLTGSAKGVSKALFLTVSSDAASVSKNGVISAVAGPVNFDAAPPKGTIKVKGKSWSSLQTEKKTYAYTNEGQKVSITSEDTYGGSGISKVYYYISNKCHTSKSDLNDSAGDGWEQYGSDTKPGLMENKLNFAYAKIVDKVGNETYISTQGIWYDTKKPSVDSAKASDISDTEADLEVKGSDGESGVKNYYSLVKKKGEKKPKAADVKNSGRKNDDGQFEITGLTEKTVYIAYSVVEDEAGNLSEVKETKITTKEKDKNAATPSAEAGTAAAGATGAAGAAGAKGGSGGAAAGGSAAQGSGGASDAKGGSGSTASERIKEGEKILEAAAGAETAMPSGESVIKDRVPYIEDASDGIMIGREKTSGWDRIRKETDSADAPAQITVDMNGGSVVPGGILDSINNRDMTMHFVMNEDVTWTVNGMSISTNDLNDLDLKVKTNTKNIPSDIVNQVADVYPHINLTLEEEGDLGLTAIMTLNVGEENRGMFANLYYYNEKENSLEFISSGEVDNRGRVSFDFNHASDYTVIVRGDALTEKTAASLMVPVNVNYGKDATDVALTPVNTGRSHSRLWLFIISVISFILCGLILFAPDKKKSSVPGLIEGR